ncbi:MAG: class I SAM-dependent methyltransferase [Chromatiales bacterium]|nr:MAG: class I SAM-dependent methyltransferase [Chromatiales bacterium]
MYRNAKRPLAIATLLLYAAGCAPEPTQEATPAPATEPQPWEAAALATALAEAGRSEADTARDADRKPAEVLAFAGVAPGMTVMDVMAASGWYTEVLAVAVGPDGTAYAENPRWLLEAMNGAPDKALTKRLEGDRLPNVQRKDAGLEEGTVPADSVDVALTALNFHDTVDRFGEEAGVAQLNQIYAALKPGGVLILIDHSGKAGEDNKKLHRIEEAAVEALVRQTPFQMEEEGGMLRHPEDDQTAMVFGKDIRGKTDRFVLKLRKPG